MEVLYGLHPVEEALKAGKRRFDQAADAYTQARSEIRKRTLRAETLDGMRMALQSLESKLALLSQARDTDRAKHARLTRLRPYFHKVCIAPVDGVCSTDILVLRPVALWMPFVLCHVSSKTLIEYATRLSNGAKMPRTKWQDLYSYPIAVPSERLAEKFADVIRPIVLKGRSSS